jgi:flagellar biosynthesis chaperone FliJ
MKKLFIIISLLSITAAATCQIYVNNNGNVGMGTNVIDATTKLNLAMNGKLLALKLGTNNTCIGAYDGTLYSRITFWHTDADFNELFAKKFTTNSDSALKTDIVPLKNVIPIIKLIKTYSYYFKSDTRENRQREFGILAQEVEKIIPELISTVKMEDDFYTKSVNYDGFIPFLIEAVKEQQDEIEMLQKIISAQEMELVELKELRKEFYALQEIVYNSQNLQIHNTSEEKQLLLEKAVLYQNTPNPFSSNTEIVCNLPKATKQAAVYIYNLQGIELKAYSITQAGLNTIIINGLELSSGMYLYSLVIDNEVIDTKRMILTK